jgi:orotidine-5'-phosphate decarboxylase
VHAESGPIVIVALDFAHARDAYDLAQRLDPSQCRLKVGQELFTAAGPQLVERLVARGFGVFLDLKFHDIPNTVQGACRAAAALGVWMLNVHAAGGRAMLTAAREAIAAGPSAPKLTAVTLLTSMAVPDLEDIGVQGTPGEAVLRLANLAQACGLDGVVCSAQEAALLRASCGSAFCLVTPGIRPIEDPGDDQQRVSTPARAIASGAHYLVIGRPITRAPDPLSALERVNREISCVGRGTP